MLVYGVKKFAINIGIVFVTFFILVSCSDGNKSAIPSANIRFPTSVSLTNASKLSVTGTANNANGVAAVRVNGLSAISSNSFSTWRITIPITDNPTVLSVEVEDVLGNIDSVAAQALVYRSLPPKFPSEVSLGPVFETPESIIIDYIRNRALIVDSGLNAIVQVDLDTGDRSIFSSTAFEKGVGLDFISPVQLVIDGPNKSLLVIDTDNPGLLEVKLRTGQRNLISSISGIAGTGPDFLSPTGVAYDTAQNRALVVDDNLFSLFSVSLNIARGHRNIISTGNNGPALIGDGPNIVQPRAIVFDEPRHRVLIIDNKAEQLSPALMAVNLVDGSRKILSSINRPSTSSVQFISPQDLALDEEKGRVLVIDAGLDAIVSVDIANGNRAIITDGSNSGVGLATPSSIFYDSANNRIFVLSKGLRALLLVEPQSGDTVIVSM